MAGKAKTSPWVYVVAIIAIIAVAALAANYMAEPTPQTPPPQTPPPSQTGGTAAPTAAPASAVATSNEGILSFTLTSSTGATGTTSNLLLLDPSQAVLKNGLLDVEATRYSLHKIQQEKGLGGLKAFGKSGSPKAITPSTGAWTDTKVQAKIGDKVLVYTYVNTTPVAAQNYTTVHLVDLIDFYRETGTWVARAEGSSDGSSWTPDDYAGYARSKADVNAWELSNYALYDWYDGSGVNWNGYVYGDSASAATDKIITWYSQAHMQGEELVDGYVYMEAPSNYTSKFKYLKVTDQNGNSVKFNQVAGKAENFVGSISIAATVLPSVTFTTNNLYFMGKLRADTPAEHAGQPLYTKYTSADPNRLTWELKTDTYGNNQTLRFFVIQNGGALGTPNGAFQIQDQFQVILSKETSSWFKSESN